MGFIELECLNSHAMPPKCPFPQSCLQPSFSFHIGHRFDLVISSIIPCTCLPTLVRIPFFLHIQTSIQSCQNLHSPNLAYNPHFPFILGMNMIWSSPPSSPAHAYQLW